MSSIDYRTCPLCEATCGLEVGHADGKVIRIRGDRDDVFSHGFICPKGSTLGKLDEDPDRLRAPLIRQGGSHRPASWDEAFAEIERGLLPVIQESGSDSVGVYLGNPNVHSMSGVIYPRILLKMLRTKAIFSASTVDQMPKHVSSGLMFGHPDLIPVPDIDRTSYLLMMGANPYESNGSLATAPDWPGRLKKIRERGGKLVVVDPPTSTSSSGPGPTPCSSLRWPLPSSRMTWSILATSMTRSTAWRRSRRWWTRSHRRPWPPRAGSRLPRSVVLPTSSPPPTRPRYTVESGPTPPSSGPWPRG
jgi:hypothetical protein